MNTETICRDFFVAASEPFQVMAKEKRVPRCYQDGHPKAKLISYFHDIGSDLNAP